jgi:hypothetical protein
VSDGGEEREKVRRSKRASRLCTSNSGNRALSWFSVVRRNRIGGLALAMWAPLDLE